MPTSYRANAFVASAACLLALLTLSADAVACSLRPHEPVRPAAHYIRAEDAPIPVIKSVSYTIRRGTNKDYSSCSDLGLIEFQIEPEVWKKLPPPLMSADFGHQFELVESNVEGSLFTPFGNEPISPSGERDGKYLYRFAWIDGAKSSQGPVEFKLNVYAVDGLFRQSAPCEVFILHVGGPTTKEKTGVETVTCRKP